jgi:hypothetical protein
MRRPEAKFISMIHKKAASAEFVSVKIFSFIVQ